MAVHVCFMRFAVWPNCQSIVVLYYIPVKYSSPVDNSLLYLCFTLPKRQCSCQWMQMTCLTWLSFQVLLVYVLCQEMAYLDVSLKINHIRDQKYYPLISNQPFYRGLDQFFHNLSCWCFAHSSFFLWCKCVTLAAGKWEQEIIVEEKTSDQKCTILLSHCLSFSESCLCLALQLILWSHVKKWLNQRWNHSFTSANKILDRETRTAQFWFQGSVITVMISCNGVWETRGNCKKFSHCASAFCDA